MSDRREAIQTQSRNQPARLYALHLIVGCQPVAPVDVTGLPWTEVDFVEDLRRADAEVFPKIARLEGS